MTLLATPHLLGATAQRDIALELGASLPLFNVRTLTSTGLASDEAFGSATATGLFTVAAASLPDDAVFGTSKRIFPKGARGTHPTTNDTRTTVTGPADLSGKNFTQPVTITGTGITGTGVSFAKKPTFQDVSATLTDVWFDQNTVANLADIIGATTTTNVTIRRFTANQFKGDALNIDGAFIGTINLYNGLIRPQPADAGSSRVITGTGLSSDEAFGTATVKRFNIILASALDPDDPLGGADILTGTTGELGPAQAITVTGIGDQIYHDSRDGVEDWTGAQMWRAQRWFDLYMDKEPFGRIDKTAPGVTYAGEVVVASNGTVTGPSTGFTLATVGSVKTLTFDLRCYAIRVNGDPANPQNLVIKGKLWTVDPNADNSANLTAFNQTYESSVGDNALLEFHDCTVGLQNAYTFGGSQIPCVRFDNCRKINSSTPMIDGGFFEAFAHDGVKFGQGSEVWLRHCSWRPHVYIASFIDPVNVGHLPLIDAGAPPNWSATTTYPQWQAVSVPRGGSIVDKYYSLVSGNLNHPTPPSGLGGRNAYWQFYGNIHTDENQLGAAVNDGTTMAWENCFWYQGQHTSIFIQHVFDNNTGKLLGSQPESTWSATADYPGNAAPSKTNKTSVVRASNGQEFVATANSGPTLGGAKDPLTTSGFWTPGSGHALVARYCIGHGNSIAMSNKSLDPANGVMDSVFGPDFALNPVQANGGGDNADGVHVVNKRNRYADSANGNPFLAGSTTS